MKSEIRNPKRWPGARLLAYGHGVGQASRLSLTSAATARPGINAKAQLGGTTTKELGAVNRRGAKNAEMVEQDGFPAFFASLRFTALCHPPAAPPSYVSSPPRLSFVPELNGGASALTWQKYGDRRDACPTAGVSDFGFRFSFGFRISDFGFPPLSCPAS
jgi:hypothetical protein